MVSSHAHFLKKLLEDVLQQNKGLNQERKKHGIQENPAQERGERKYQGTASLERNSPCKNRRLAGFQGKENRTDMVIDAFNFVKNYTGRLMEDVKRINNNHIKTSES